MVTRFGTDKCVTMNKNCEELERFRTAWKEELREVLRESQDNGDKTQSFNSKPIIHEDINGDTYSHDRFCNSNNKKCLTPPPPPSSSSSSSSQSKSKADKQKTIPSNQPKDIVLLNLPNPDLKLISSKSKKIRKIDSDLDKHENLLEVLISDIDDITSVPFFDLQLPREIGLKIFHFLGMKDLCHCAIVSKSWKHLADDDMLWYSFGVRLGFVEKDCVISKKTDWKGFICKCMIEQRQEQSRWRERICRVDVMEYERGGVLCSVSEDRHQLCAGYSSGDVLLWDMNKLTYKLLNNDVITQQGIYPTCCTVNNNLTAAGYSNGGMIIWNSSLSTSPIHHCQLEEAAKSVVLSPLNEPVAVYASDNELRIDVTNDNGQWFCLKQKNFENKIQDIKMLSCSKNSVRPTVVMTTRDTLNLHGTLPQDDVIVLDHVIGGKMTCIDCNTDMIAVGVSPYGYGILGNTVRTYCPDTGQLISVLTGHYHEVTCLNLQDSPPGLLVTGSFDKRVRIYDLRSEVMALSLRGHEDYVTTVQIDDWKVVSGAHNGELCVWDLRTSAVLWRTHARHPVSLCHFDGVRMVMINIPHDKTPQPNLWYADDLILHRRARGSIRVFDFSTDNVTQGVPGICSSGYDDTSGYNYNIALVTPYDDINE